MKPRLDGFHALAKHVLETAKRLEAQQKDKWEAQQQANKKEQYISAIDIRMRALDGWMRGELARDAQTRHGILQSIDLTEISRLREQSLVDQGVVIKRPQALQVPLGKITKVSDFVRYRLEHRTLDQTGQTRLYAILDDDVDAAAYAIYQTTTNNTSTTTKEPTE